jgi:hypothetical protein
MIDELETYESRVLDGKFWLILMSDMSDGLKVTQAV